MTRLTLIHRNAKEANERADVLRQADYDVSCQTDARGPTPSARTCRMRS